MNENARPKHAGLALIDHVVAILIEYGYEELNRCTSPLATMQGYKKKVFMRNVKAYEDLYGHIRSNHIMLVDNKNFKRGLIIDVRWQAISGSVDQKYPFFMLSLLSIDMPSIMVLDGQGMREEAVDWLKSKQDGKHFVLSSLGEFSRFARLSL